MNGQSTFSATSVCPRRPVCQTAAAASSARTPASSAANGGHRLKMLRGRVTIGPFAGTVRQAQLPDAARDATRFDYEAFRPVLRDARRERPRFVLRYKGKSRLPMEDGRVLCGRDRDVPRREGLAGRFRLVVPLSSRSRRAERSTPCRKVESRGVCMVRSLVLRFVSCVALVSMSLAAMPSTASAQATGRNSKPR